MSKKYLWIILMFVLAGGCMPIPAGRSQAATPESIVKSYIETANTGDFDKALAFYAGTAVVKLSDGRAFTGKDEIGKWLQEDVKSTHSDPKEYIVSGNVVTVNGMVTLARFEPLGINPIAYDLTAVVDNGRITLFIPRLMFTPEQQAKLAAAAQ